MRPIYSQVLGFFLARPDKENLNVHSESSVAKTADDLKETPSVSFELGTIRGSGNRDDLAGLVILQIR